MNLFSKIGNTLDRAMTKAGEAAREASLNFKAGMKLSELIKSDPHIVHRVSELAQEAQARVQQAAIERSAAKHAEHRKALIERKLARLGELKEEAFKLLDELKSLNHEVD